MSNLKSYLNSTQEKEKIQKIETDPLRICGNISFMQTENINPLRTVIITELQILQHKMLVSKLL